MNGAPPELIRRIEEAAAAAWPAMEVRDVDSWRLRFSGSRSRRANSVLPLDAGHGLSLEDKVAAVESFYAERGRPACWQLTAAAQPPGLDAVLAERGYQVRTPTAVQAAPVATVLRELAPPEVHRVRIDDGLGDEWFEAYCDAEGYEGENASARRVILTSITRPTAYASLELDGRRVGIGLGVQESEWAGVFCMATHPAARRRGVAAAILRRLAEWAERRGAERMYLQVMDESTAALALYARAGFRPLYRYHYREAPG